MQACFPEPFPFHSRIFSKISEYFTKHEDKNQRKLHLPLPKQSNFLDGDVFTDLGVKPEVFTKGRIPILVNWVFCLNKILIIEPKSTKPIVRHTRNTSGLLGVQFKVL